MSFAERVARLLDTDVRSVSAVGGGDVAESHRVTLADGRIVFAKTHRDAPPYFFETEAVGLEWLGESGHVNVPKVMAVEPGLLVLDWIHEGRASPSTEADLGRSLARLHRSGAPSFGRQDRMTTGSRRLPNEPCMTWAEFYAKNRLLPLARLAADAGALRETTIAGMVELADRLDQFGAVDEGPSRLHGDLWAGNRLVDGRGNNWLIDPAAHGGHREFDLAMMRLFSGFGENCFDAYEAEYPLADGWQARVSLHQLAPLAVHAIKFGGAYVAATERALDACR